MVTLSVYSSWRGYEVTKPSILDHICFELQNQLFCDRNLPRGSPIEASINGVPDWLDSALHILFLGNEYFSKV